MSLVHRVMGDLPYTNVERARLAGDQAEASALNADAPTEKAAPKLTADGTYIMHTALTASETAKEASKDKAKVKITRTLVYSSPEDFAALTAAVTCRNIYE